jgi:hypothetical protein
MDSEVVVAVYLSQPSLLGPAPLTRLVSYGRVFIAAGGRVELALPSVEARYRARVDNNATGEAVYTLAGKRFVDPGALQLRVCLGEHNCHLEGGYPLTVTQAGPTTDLSTC